MYRLFRQLVPHPEAIPVLCRVGSRLRAQLMDPHSIVVVSLHSPREKVWGELLDINPSGVTLRGIDLNSFDHFIRQIN